MVRIARAELSDREGVENLIAEYHSSEGLVAMRERIAWAVYQLLRDLFPGLLLVARDGDVIAAVALAVYLPSAELGRVMNVHDFYVRPSHSKGNRERVGKASGGRG